MSYKKILILCCIVFQDVAFGRVMVDLYGDDTSMGQHILAQFQAAIVSVEARYIQLEATYQNHIPESRLKPVLEQHQQICDHIKQVGHYVYANFERVYYPKTREHYVTIEVVRQQDRHRLNWISVDPPANPPPVDKSDVIQMMQAYLDQGIQLLLTHQLNPSQIHCQRSHHHCLFGFEHVLLKPYQKHFDQAVRTQHAYLLHTLTDDAVPERRVAAAYLIGEMRDPRQVLSILAPRVTDRNVNVRNAVMRVIAETMHHTGLKTIQVKPFIDLIDSPDESDRNKALFVLLQAADVPAQKQIMKQGVQPVLMRLSRLKQPNNREPAALLLDKLSV